MNSQQKMVLLALAVFSLGCSTDSGHPLRTVTAAVGPHTDAGVGFAKQAFSGKSRGVHGLVLAATKASSGDGPSWKMKAFVTAIVAAFLAMFFSEAIEPKIKGKSADVRRTNFDMTLAVTVLVIGPLVGFVVLIACHVVLGFGTWSWFYLPVNLLVGSFVSGYVIHRTLIGHVRGVDPSGRAENKTSRE